MTGVQIAPEDRRLQGDSALVSLVRGAPAHQGLHAQITCRPYAHPRGTDARLYAPEEK